MAKFYAKAPNGDDAVLSISIQNFTQSLQQNGWCKLPNGLIIQWEPSSSICKKLLDFSLSLISRVMYIAGEAISLINKNVTQTQISCIEMVHEPQKHDTNFGFMSEKIGEKLANFTSRKNKKIKNITKYIFNLKIGGELA